MSGVNRYKPHVCILPEDEATSQIANGFALRVKDERVIKIEHFARGWTDVEAQMLELYTPLMLQFPEIRLVLLIDFDFNSSRLERIRSNIPDELQKRVFVFGAFSEAEDLKRQNGAKNLEAIGKTLAQECQSKSYTLWNHELLQHLETELLHAQSELRPLLFT